MKITLKYRPSLSIHYLHCPYFLKLSNIVKIPIEEPFLPAIQRAQYFKEIVISRISSKKGAVPIRVKRPLDIILKEGLLLISKKLDIEFFSTNKVSLQIGIFKPDLIEVNKDKEIMEINIKSIKSTTALKDYHYLQSYTYKLALKKALKGTTIKPYEVGTSLIYCNNDDFIPANDIDDFDIEMLIRRMMEEEFFTEINTDNAESDCISNLQHIASLKAHQDKSKCEVCIGRYRCDLYHDIDFKDSFSWFQKFE